ncbi:TY2B-C [Symbiodinium sp. CCMP2592]|nr:TY2B-C [Symbiodinium sp. CCMP2592]
MSRPNEGGGQPVLEGEASGPNYGAVNGVVPGHGARRTGATSALPLGRAVSVTDVRRSDSSGQADVQGTIPAVSDEPSTSTTLPTGLGATHGTHAQPTTQQPTAPLAQPPQPATAPAQSQSAAPEPPQLTTTTLEPQRIAPPPPPPQPLPQRPLQHAVHQLQRTAVVQAVQARAQRALHSVRGEDVFSSAESLVGSPQSVLPREDEGRSQNGWSVTRISEVLHRRFVAPVLEHVGGSDRPVGPSPTWHSPSNQGFEEQPLMTAETRQAMAEWTARPTSLTLPVGERVHRDDSSAGSVNREAVMEEVKRQVQLAMQSRDQEVRTLKDQNEELKRALDASAQLLNEVMIAGGEESAPGLRGTSAGLSGNEPGGVPAGEGEGARRRPSAPPGLEGRLNPPVHKPFGQGRGEPAYFDRLLRYDLAENFLTLLLES